MGIVSLIAIIIILLFGFVVFFGAPYLPTTQKQVSAALDLLNLQKGQILLELGAGDGKVSIEALKRGYRVTAIELNPLLCIVIFFRTLRYRSSITIKCGNFWHVSWGDYDGIYTFLLDKYMKRLDTYIIRQNKRVMLASFAFKIPQKQILAEKDGIYLYNYSVGDKS